MLRPTQHNQEAIFELLLEIMHVVKSRDIEVIRARALVLSQSLAPRDESINLLHPYIVMVLLAFMQCGLVEVLTTVAMSSDKEFSRVAQNLLMEILRLASDLLPRSHCLHLNVSDGMYQF